MEAVVPLQRTNKTLRTRRPVRTSALLVSEAVIAPIEQHLQTTGWNRCEEAAMIAGYIVGRSVAVATTALLPYTEHSSGGCEVPLDVTFRCSRFVRSMGMVFLAQIHTHPGRSCHHSVTDDEWAICDAPGFFSIVVPCFARFGLRRTLEQGAFIYERMADGRWRALPTEEVRKRVHVIPATHAVV